MNKFDRDIEEETGDAPLFPRIEHFMVHRAREAQLVFILVAIIYIIATLIFAYVIDKGPVKQHKDEIIENVD